ncbi:hypothetical protein FEDK69T_07320 [Flavobacterium enshiense DK69]|nr:hypothetical protein FEDK69T_07320 [Flavobacterium enshiense DK69]
MWPFFVWYTDVKKEKSKFLAINFDRVVFDFSPGFNSDKIR